MPASLPACLSIAICKWVREYSIVRNNQGQFVNMISFCTQIALSHALFCRAYALKVHNITFNWIWIYIGGVLFWMCKFSHRLQARHTAATAVAVVAASSTLIFWISQAVIHRQPYYPWTFHCAHCNQHSKQIHSQKKNKSRRKKVIALLKTEFVYLRKFIRWYGKTIQAHWCCKVSSDLNACLEKALSLQISNAIVSDS